MENVSNSTEIDNELHLDEEIESTLLDEDEDEDDFSDVGSDFSDISSINSKDVTCDPFSLDSLIAKKNQLINSIQNRLSSRDATPNSTVISINDSESVNNISQLSVDRDDDVSIGTKLNFEHCSASTPLLKTPAVRILDKWKPSLFSLDIKTEEKDQKPDENETSLGHTDKKMRISNDYEEKYLTDIDNYCNKLASYTEKDDKTIDDIMNELSACLQADQKVDEDFLGTSFFEIDRSEFFNDIENDKTLLANRKSLNDLSDKSERLYHIDTKKTITKSKEVEDSSQVPSTNLSGLRSNLHLDVFDTHSVAKKQLEKSVDEIDSLVVVSSDEEIETAAINSMDEDTLLASDDEKEHSKTVTEVDFNKIEGSDKVENKRNEMVVTNEHKNETLPASNSKLDSKNESFVKKKDTVASVKELAVFISDDPAENRDNNDPMWDYLRNLGNDFERYLVVRKRWRNIEIPNPKKDLTRLHPKRDTKQIVRDNKDGVDNNSKEKKISDMNVAHISSLKRCKSFDSNKKPRRQLCTVLFDRCIKELDDEVQTQINLLQQECKEKIQHLAECQQIEKQMLMLSTNCNVAAIKLLEGNHAREAEKLMRIYIKQREEMMSIANSKLEILRYASDEVKQLHEFYPDDEDDGNSLLYLNDEEVEEIMEVDSTMRLYDQIYR